MTRPQRPQTYSPISESNNRFVLPHSGHFTVTICFVTFFHPVYFDKYNVVEAIFKYDVCHISSLRLLSQKLSTGTFDKTYLPIYLNDLNAIRDEILVHKSKPPFRINVYGSNSLAPTRNSVLCGGPEGSGNGGFFA